MKLRGCLLAGPLLCLGLIGLNACDEGGADPAVTSAPQSEVAPTGGSGSSPQWGGSPALGPAKRSAQDLKEDIERRQRQLADDIDRGNDPLGKP